jgi:hypothetical protein
MNEALKQLEALLSQSATAVPRFPPNSRYHATPTATLVTPDRRVITYLRRRFVPHPELFATLREHVVLQGDRLDRLAAEHLGDPEIYYRLCDANRAIRPNELTDTVGRRLRITLPEGVPGTSDG